MSQDYDDDDEFERGEYRPDPEARDIAPAAEAARERTSLPGIFLIVVGVLNLLAVFPLSFTAIKNATVTREEFEEAQKLAKQMMPGLAGGAGAPTYEQQKVINVCVYGGWALMSLVAGILPLIGGIRMRSLHNYGLCMAGAVIAVIPCVSPTSCPCLIGAAVGIWAMVVLADRKVKAEFR